MNYNNNISFKSKINFISAENFERLGKGLETKYGRTPKLEYVEFGDKLDFFGVRSCTGIGLVDTKNKKAVGVHLYDNNEYFDNLKNLIGEMFKKVPNADRALILGGKDLGNSPFSTKQFQEAKKLIQKKVKNVTSFETHSLPNAETDLQYCAKQDCWNINTKFSPCPVAVDYSVEDATKLKQAFKKIELANGDSLLIQGKPCKID